MLLHLHNFSRKIYLHVAAAFARPLAFVAALGVLLSRLLMYRKPTESGPRWALLATFLAFQVGAAGPCSDGWIDTCQFHPKHLMKAVLSFQ